LFIRIFLIRQECRRSVGDNRTLWPWIWWTEASSFHRLWDIPASSVCFCALVHNFIEDSVCFHCYIYTACFHFSCIDSRNLWYTWQPAIWLRRGLRSAHSIRGLPAAISSYILSAAW